MTVFSCLIKHHNHATLLFAIPNLDLGNGTLHRGCKMRQTILAVLSLSAIAALLTGCGGDMVLLNSKGPVAQGQF